MTEQVQDAARNRNATQTGEGGGSRLRLLWSRDVVLSVWFLLGVITVLHYASPPSLHWAHDLLRRAYYIPIVIGAIRTGLRGGLLISLAVSILYLPHAFLHQHHFDPARGMEKSLEMVLYFSVAAVAGYLSDLEYRRRAELQRAVTEQTRLTEQLVRAGRLAALGEVVAGIAHEIKNPLHALAGTAEIVDAEVSEGSEVRPMWEIHKSEIERLRRTADTFLSFAKPAPIDRLPLDLADVAARLSELVAAQTRQHDIALKLEMPPGEVRVLGDVDQLAQVALNIAVNAIKAIGDASGTIRVVVGTETADSETLAYLTIENDGPPITPEDREHLFDPFYSGNNGAGLGLSISERIVHQHDGFFEVSEGTLGVAFTIYLPIASRDDI